MTEVMLNHNSSSQLYICELWVVHDACEFRMFAFQIDLFAESVISASPKKKWTCWNSNTQYTVQCVSKQDSNFKLPAWVYKVKYHWLQTLGTGLFNSECHSSCLSFFFWKSHSNDHISHRDQLFTHACAHTNALTHTRRRLWCTRTHAHIPCKLWCTHTGPSLSDLIIPIISLLLPHSLALSALLTAQLF